MKRECETCIKRKTLYCPPAIDCMATDDMPYYQNRIMLLEENQKLKKQLEKYSKIGVADHKYASECEDKVITMENQQKEFIEYLENEINKIKEQIRTYDIWHEVGLDINFLILKKQFFVEILSKYKKTIGVSNEN